MRKEEREWDGDLNYDVMLHLTYHVRQVVLPGVDKIKSTFTLCPRQ